MKKIIITIISLVVLFTIASVIFFAKVDKRDLESLIINQYPTKLEYYLDEHSDFHDIKASAIYENGKSIDLDFDDLSFSGFSSKEEGKKTVTVTYKEVSTTFDVDIIKKVYNTKVLEKIELRIDNVKKIYQEGDSLNTKGGDVIKIYSDGTKEVVPLLESYVSRFNSYIITDELELKVTYFENNLPYVAYYTVKVVPKDE